MTPRAVVLLALGVLCSASCVGPTLEVGERMDELGDAGEAQDASLDAGDARVRDASFSDRGAFPERLNCREERDCALFNVVRDHCNLTFGVCVQCVDDWQCASGRCIESEGRCRDTDKDSDKPSSGP